MGNKGVTFGLNSVQKWADGERFSGRQSADDAFDDIQTEGLDDENNYSDDEDINTDL
jgi:hypothetical protein